jgi:hypothetical protein
VHLARLSQVETLNKLISFFGTTSHDNDTIFVCGQTGSGKSTLIANLLNDGNTDFVLVDTKSQHGQLPNCEHCYSLAAVVDAFDAYKRRIVLHCPMMTEDELNSLATVIVLHQERNIAQNDKWPELTVAIDELNYFVSVQRAPQGIVELSQRGRPARINRIYGVQWLNHVPAKIRDGVTELYCFRQYDSAADDVYERWGIDPAAIHALPPLQAIHRANDTLERIVMKPKTEKTKEKENEQ